MVICFALVPVSCEDVFTYVDRIMDDQIKFFKWIDECEAQRRKAREAIAIMKAHPWFSEFCRQVGASEEQWGKLDGDPIQEYLLFKEWLEAAEQDLTRVMCTFVEASGEHVLMCLQEILESHRGSEKAQEATAAARKEDWPSNMETQVDEPIEVPCQYTVCPCICHDQTVYTCLQETPVPEPKPTTEEADSVRRDLGPDMESAAASSVPPPTSEEAKLLLADRVLADQQRKQASQKAFQASITPEERKYMDDFVAKADRETLKIMLERAGQRFAGLQPPAEARSS